MQENTISTLKSGQPATCPCFQSGAKKKGRNERHTGERGWKKKAKKGVSRVKTRPLEIVSKVGENHNVRGKSWGKTIKKKSSNCEKRGVHEMQK